MEIINIAWFAGLMEGEGSFLFRKPRIRMSGFPVISIQTSDLDIAERAWRLLRTSRVYKLKPRRINGNTGKKTIYSVISTRASVNIGWMLTLYSFMGRRRKEDIRIVVSKWKLAKDNRGRYRKGKLVNE